MNLPQPNLFTTWEAWAREIVRRLESSPLEHELARILVPAEQMQFAFDPKKGTIRLTAQAMIADGVYGDITVSGGGTILTVDPSLFAAAAHTHDATDVISGVFDPTRLGTGTPDGTKVLYGDGTWDVPPGGGSGIADGDFGDVVVSGSGTVLTVDANAITFAKMQAVSTNVLLGNDASGTAVEEITCTAAGRALLDDADAAAQRATLGVPWAMVKKTADTARTATTTLAADPDLQVALVAGKTYVIKGTVFITVDAAVDLKTALSYSGTLTSVYLFQAFNNPATSFSTSSNFTRMQEAMVASEVSTFTATATSYIAFEIAITPSSNGTFAFAWSQNTSGAGPVTVRKGSYLEVMEVV